MKKRVVFLLLLPIILISGCITQVPEIATEEQGVMNEVLGESSEEVEIAVPDQEYFLTQRIEDAMEQVDCPPFEELEYPDSYYHGPLIDTHLHVPPIPDWPPEEDRVIPAERLKGRFGGPEAFLGWNVKMGDIACALKHEGTTKTFAFFPVYEDLPGSLIEIAHQAVEQYPELFTPFIGASGNDGDPNGFPVTDATTLRKMLDIYPGLFKGFGEIGLYEREGGSNALPPDALRLQEIYPLVNEHNLVVYFHPGRGQLRNFERVLAQHQEINFIVHGEELEEDIESLMDKYPNIYYGVELGLGEEDPQFSRLFVGDDKEKFLEAMGAEFNRALGDHLRKWKPMIERHPDRFIFGTDRGDAAWQYDIEVGQKLVKLSRAFIGRLDSAVQEKFAYKNAEILIKQTHEKVIDRTQKSIGYVGCSITHQTVEGYWEAEEESIWPPEQRYDDGSVMNWGKPQSRWWDAFNENLKKYPETNIIWLQLCLPKHEFPMYNDVNIITDSIKARLPNATIYVSSLAPYEHLCEGSGATGVQRGQKLAEELAAKRADVKLGPTFSALTLSETENDQCHLNKIGKQKLGKELMDFFEKE